MQKHDNGGDGHDNFLQIIKKEKLGDTWGEVIFHLFIVGVLGCKSLTIILYTDISPLQI